MSSHISSPPLAARRRGGTWKYAVPDAAGPGAAKFRENLRRLGGEELMAADPPAGTPGAGARPADAARPADTGRPARPARPVR